jgi:hypothetical protein
MTILAMATVGACMAGPQTPLDIVVELATGDGSEPTQEVSISRASHEAEAEYLRASEATFGDISQFGMTDDEYLNESYRWCAALQAYGGQGARTWQNDMMEATFPAREWGLMRELLAAQNSLIETYLCPQ